MIAALTFVPAQERDGRRIRTIAFATRSTLPRSAVCVVANGVRETLGGLLARPIEVDAIEPVIPAAAARRTLLEGALVHRVRGRLCDAFVIVRPLDARRVVALAYGEADRSESAPLSEIERATLERVVAPLLPLCASLCGEIRSSAREPYERAVHDLIAYFEVRASAGATFAIGFGLSHDPPEAVGATLALDDVLDVELPARAIFARGAIGVPAFARLRPGETLPLDTPLGAPGELEIGGVRFGRGACGSRDGRAVLAFGSLPEKYAAEIERGAA